MSDKIEVKVLVEGGKASPAPPLGPTLAPLKVNVGKIVADINAKTKEMAGMQVPVIVKVDPVTKEYTISVGTPPVSALIKKELGLAKGSEIAGIKRIGDLNDAQVRKIAKIKFGHDSEGNMKMVVGTARSMGISFGKGAVTAEEIAKAEAYLKAKEAEATKPAEGAVPAEGAAAAPAEGAKKAEAGGKKEEAGAKKDEKKPEAKGKTDEKKK